MIFQLEKLFSELVFIHVVMLEIQTSHLESLTLLHIDTNNIEMSPCVKVTTRNNFFDSIRIFLTSKKKTNIADCMYMYDDLNKGIVTSHV